MSGTRREKGIEGTARRYVKAKGTWLRLCEVALLVILLSTGQAKAIETSEVGLFTAVAPDAMIVLDLSGSMKWNPPGDHDAYNYPTKQYSNSTCSGPFYDDQSVPGYTTYCSRFEIARKTLFNDPRRQPRRHGQCQRRDKHEHPLRPREVPGEHLRQAARHRDQVFPDLLRQTTTSCTVDQASGDTSSINYWMTYYNVVGATPLVSALSGVKSYLDTHKTTDSYQSCRQKFVILVSDGADTMSCGGTGYDTQADQYKRRRDSVLAVKALADAGYKVFVIGMGSNMPDHLKNTLNWMAYWGGTDNPLIPNCRFHVGL